MDKRTFLRTTSALITSALLSPISGCKGPGEPRKNWAGNLVYHTDRLRQPATIAEVQYWVNELNKLKALGSRHSFNSIADSDANQISLENLDPLMAIDEKSMTVTVAAGVTYGKLSRFLHGRGYALHNLASLPHISVAGACATATHGSGIRNGNLSTAVSGLELVNGKGEVIVLNREKDGDQFLGVVVGLGALGIITKVTLAIQPTFDVRQDVFLDLPLDQLKDHFDEIISSGYSVSLFTDWTRSSINQVWVKRRIETNPLADLPGGLSGATPATRNVHPIISISAENCTPQMGVPGPWHERLPHFKMNFVPSSGKELQAEYFVPYKHAVEAILAINHIHEKVSPLLQISEIRTIASDRLWMSPCCEEPSVSIHFTLKQDLMNVQKLLPVIERELAPFNPKPHWAKLFTIDPSRLKASYKKLPDFRDLSKQYDPEGKFRNEFLDRNVFLL